MEQDSNKMFYCTYYSCTGGKREVVMDKKFYRDSHPIGVADDDFILSIIIPFSQKVHTTVQVPVYYITTG